MSLKRASVGTLRSKVVSSYKFSSNRLSLRRFPFPSAPGRPTAVYVEDVFSNYVYTGDGVNGKFIQNEIELGPSTGVGKSLLFDGSGDYLTVADSSSLDLGTKDFTVEMWLYSSDYTTTSCPFCKRGTTVYNPFLVDIRDGDLILYLGNDSSTWSAVLTIASLPVNQWIHVAFSRSANTISGFLNGIPRINLSYSAAVVDNSLDWVIGGRQYGASSTQFFNGYISNLRMVVGTALYSNTTSFTPSTTSLTSVANTQLLIAQSPDPFIDYSLNSYTANVFGNTASSDFGPFSSTGSGKGGMVWIKGRDDTQNHAIYDTTRRATFDLGTNLNTAQTKQPAGLTAFANNGFFISSLASVNFVNQRYASWTFRKQEKFFDIVTYTGTGSAKTVAHNLGSTPGCVIVKRVDSTGDWAVYHRGLASAEQNIYLNLTTPASTATTIWNSTAPTSTEFSIGTATVVNDNGGNYIAYLFAHDAGGFGDLGTDNIISCGTYLGSNHRAGEVVEVGFEPQWVLIRNITTTGQRWILVDNIRGMASGNRNAWLFPNATTIETTLVNDQVIAAPTGFFFGGPQSDINEAGSTFIYIAIRRGPMRTPTDPTKVFQPIVYTGTNVDNRLVPTGILTDMILARQRNSTTVTGLVVGDRLRGDEYLTTANTAVGTIDADSLMTPTLGYGNSFSAMNGFGVGNDGNLQLNISVVSDNQIAEAFARAPGFFDIASYVGNATARTVTHNLGVTPELMIIKNRSDAQNWVVYLQSLGPARRLYFNSASAPAHASSDIFNTTDPTSAVFSVGNDGQTNSSTHNFVAYLFATLPGISKVGTYAGIGAGTSQQIDCGFTSGARFVLIKRIDGVAGDDWFVWDSARGITSDNDPYLKTSSAGAEVTNTDYIEPSSVGFEVSNSASSVMNDVGVATWTTRTSTFSLNAIAAVTYGNNTFVATGYAGKAATSNSGIDWVARTISSGTTDRYLSVTYGDGPGLFATCGTDTSTNLLSTSTNGITWTGRSTSLSSSICNSLNGITYGSGTFVAVGANAKIISSTTGIDWTSRTNGFGTSAINAVTYGDNQFVAVGASGKIATSNDGIIWTQQTNSNTSVLRSVVYGNGLYVAGGSSGVILTSPDAVTWTLQTSGFGADAIYGLSYGEGVFVAVGASGKLRTSSDGVTWTSRTSGFSSLLINGTTYGKSMFVNVGDNGTLTTAYPNNYIYLAIA